MNRDINYSKNNFPAETPGHIERLIILYFLYIYKFFNLLSLNPLLDLKHLLVFALKLVFSKEVTTDARISLLKSL